MALVLVAAVLAWPLMVYAGYWWARRESVTVSGLAVPPEATNGQYLVVARTASGARARQMWERGMAGAGESLELWDGTTCRGRKAIPASKEA